MPVLVRIAAHSGLVELVDARMVGRASIMQDMQRQTTRPRRRKDRCGREFWSLVLAFGGLISWYLPTAHAAFQEPGANAPSFDQLAARAHAAMDDERTAEAIRLYERATALRPSWSEGWWFLGTLAFDSGQIVKAHDAFLHFVSVEHEQAGPGFGMLGLTEFELKDYKKALAALERGIQLGLGDNDAFTHQVVYAAGVVNNLLDQPEIALVRLTLVANQEAAAHPENSEVTVLADTDLLDAFGLAALRIEKLPGEIPAKDAAMVRQAGHAQVLIALQDRATAGVELKQLVAQYPSEPGIHYMYGVHLLKEDPLSAVEEFQRELAISPHHAAARIQLALEFLRTADYKQGLKYAQEAVMLAPGNFVAHVACGKLWLETGDTDHALSELRTAVKLSPGSPDAHFALSRALSEAGQSHEAAQERAEFERLKALTDAADRK